MNINLQHHNLLGNKISPKSEDFCIWWPFCTLVTMATAAILIFFNPPKSCHILRWIFLQSGYQFPTSKSTWKPNFSQIGGFLYFGGHFGTNDGYQFATSYSTWKSNFTQIGGFLYFGGHFGFKMVAIANQ
jgi:hypothetical protein